MVRNGCGRGARVTLGARSCIAVSTRPKRAGFPLAQWALERAKLRGGFDVELVHLRDADFPLFDEPNHPRIRQCEHEHTKRWSEKIAAADE